MFSIIIPTCNRAEILKKSLTYLLKMNAIETCEIIIVDDGSNDHTGDIVHSYKKQAVVPISYIRQENQGPGIARNTGLDHAKYDTVLFIDDDVYPNKDLVIQHQQFLKKGYDVSQGILLWHPSIENDRLVQFMEQRGMQFSYDINKESKQINYLHIYTANLAVKKEDIVECGGFDQNLSEKRYAFEDTAIAYRLYKKGRRMGLNKKAIALHYHPQTIKSIVNREYKVGFSAGILKTDYPEIFKRLNFDRIVRFPHFQAAVLRMITGTLWVDKIVGYNLALRAKLRAAFIKGYIEYKRAK